MCKMITRVKDLLRDLFQKQKSEKGIGKPAISNWHELADVYLDRVMEVGFMKFFPEIFTSAGGPVRHKPWEEQPAHDLGEKAAKRALMRVVRRLCRNDQLLQVEDGQISSFPLFVDWTRHSHEGVFSTRQLMTIAPLHLKHCGWYIESVSFTEAPFVDDDDERLLQVVLKEIEDRRASNRSDEMIGLQRVEHNLVRWNIISCKVSCLQF
jgi:hypothetical protein